MLKNLSPGLQVLIFLFIIYFLAGMGNVIMSLALNVVIDQEVLINTNYEDPRFLLTYFLFFQIFGFLIAFLAILRFTQERFEDVINIGRLKLKPLLYTFMLFIIGMAVLPLMTWLNKPLGQLLPASALENEAYRDSVNQSMMVQDDPIQFGFVFIIMSILPAICEELVFRGYLLKKMFQSGMGMHTAVALSSAIFALTHFQPLKFLPMFFLGLCLGYVYTYFKNIKYSIILHFLINGSQIVMAYLVGTGVLDMEI